MSDSDDFVTVAQAAQRLGISERQVRRDVRTLPDTDRRMSGKGPARVRLSALIELRGKPLPEAETEKETPDTVRPMSESVRKEPDNAGYETGALVDQLRADLLQARADLEHERGQHQADNERWSKALDQGQQLHLAAVADLQEMRRRAAELEAQNAKLIAALPAEADTTAIAPGSPDSEDRPVTGINSHPDLSAGDSEGLPVRRGFFARLFGR